MVPDPCHRSCRQAKKVFDAGLHLAERTGSFRSRVTADGLEPESEAHTDTKRGFAEVGSGPTTELLSRGLRKLRKRRRANHHYDLYCGSFEACLSKVE